MTAERVFADFVAAHSRSLYGTAYLLTGDVDAAEDLLQETLTRLYPKWAQVERADAPVAYVRRALANRFVSSTRTRAGHDLAMWDLPDMAADVDIAARVSDQRLLWQLLRALPERQRAALVLRYFHDLPDAEIANALGCREVTVRSLVSRGVAAMRDHLQRDDAEHDQRGGERR
jgi:RNA polymerase sigma-70 factor (sigma-E family)